MTFDVSVPYVEQSDAAIPCRAWAHKQQFFCNRARTVGVHYKPSVAELAGYEEPAELTHLSETDARSHVQNRIRQIRRLWA